MKDQKEFKAALELARAERMDNVKAFIERKCHLTNEQRLELLNIIADDSLIHWAMATVAGKTKGLGAWKFNTESALDGIDRMEKRLGISLVEEDGKVDGITVGYEMSLPVPVKEAPEA